MAEPRLAPAWHGRRGPTCGGHTDGRSSPRDSSPTADERPPGVRVRTADGRRRTSRPSWRTPQQRSERVKLRRALTFLGMTLVLPGSAQIAAGNKRGRPDRRCGSGSACGRCSLLLGLFALVWRSAAIALFTTPTVLRVVQVAADRARHRLGPAAASTPGGSARPPELARRHRLGFAVLSLGPGAAPWSAAWWPRPRSSRPSAT